LSEAIDYTTGIETAWLSHRPFSPAPSAKGHQMTQAESDLAQQLTGRAVVDPAGAKIGKVGQVYLNDHSGQPEWVTVSTGLFGTKESFVPLRGADYSSDAVVVQVSKDVVKDAPQVENDGHLEPSEEQTLYRYYAEQLGTGFDTEQATGTSDNGAGHDTSGPNTDEAITRSEERLHVDTEQFEAGRARLRKYVVTENVTQTVPVSHEEVLVEREPITDANRNAALSGGDITEEEHEVTLHAERPVVAKETVPVERVKLGTETVTEQQQIDEQVRKEHIEYDEDTQASQRAR
jgi:uncharacterized protein (TIGR02271 family)